MRTNDERSFTESRSTFRLPHWSCWLALAVGVLLVGCTKPTTVVTDVEPAGTYTLVSVDGKKVPCTVKHDGAELTVKAGTFIISADGVCSSKMTFTTPVGSDASREVKASYTREGSTLTMKWEGAGTTIGTVEGNTFTMNNEGMVFTYRK